MSEDAVLIEEREELKRQLLLGNRKTLVELILDGTGHLIQKLSRSSEPPSFLYCALLISLFTLLLDLLISFLHGEFEFSYRRRFISIEVLTAGMIFMLLVTLKMYFDFLFRVFRDRLVDNIQSLVDLLDLQTWAAKVWSSKRTLLFGMVCTVICSSYFFIPMAALGALESSAIGALTMGGALFFIGGITSYYFLHLLILPLHLSRYNLRIYGLDPRSSEVIEDISNLIAAFAYLIATFMAVVTTVIVLIGWTTLPAIAPVVLITWALVIALFVTNHYALSRIIIRTKWQTLNSLQMRIEQIRAQKNLTEKETMEAINRLMDYHDRIRGTPNSALNLRVGLDLVNSLLLPLLALLLSNLKHLVELISR